jgi:rhodanese-related sulfurtransferase
MNDFASAAENDLGERLPRRAATQMVPAPLEGRPGLFVVDATWGKIAPMQLAAGVRTIGELELISGEASDLLLIDTRPEEAYARETIPGAFNLPWQEAAQRAGELPANRPSIFFCNGPQCAATPRAIAALLDAGTPPERILYYRGGLHDWITLGLPVAPPPGHPRQTARRLSATGPSC